MLGKFGNNWKLTEGLAYLNPVPGYNTIQIQSLSRTRGYDRGRARVLCTFVFHLR